MDISHIFSIFAESIKIGDYILVGSDQKKYKNIMCKYCDDGKTIGTVLGTVAVEDGQICLVSGSIWNTIVGNIKYCPMCGKELSSKTLKELEKENKILEKKAIKYKEEEENEKDEYEEDEEW